MRVECSMCATPLPDGADPAAIAQVACACGALGNWQQAKTTEESFADDLAALVERAKRDGVTPTKIAEAFNQSVAVMDAEATAKEEIGG